MKIIIFFSLVFFSNLSIGDVLFIDLNNVDMEIQVAREAAQKRGEKLIVLPLDRGTYQSTERNKLGRAIDEIVYQTAYCKTTEACNKLNERKKSLMKQLQDLGEESVYDFEKLKKDLKKVNGNFNTIMISGHDGGGNFYGEFGSIRGNEFLNLFKDYQGRDKVRSLYLLGCNSATVDTFGSLWKVAFPRAAFIAGYEGIGYLRDNGLGHSFIKKVMGEEQSILASVTMAEAQRKFRSLSPKDSEHGTAACFVMNGKPDPIYLSSTNKSELLEESLGCGKDLIEKMIAYKKCALSESSPCSLTLPSELVDVKLEQCGAIFGDKFDDIIRLRNTVYMLGEMNKKSSWLSVESIFHNAPEKVKKDLDINPGSMKTYAQVKEKLLALKHALEKMFDYDVIKDEPMKELVTRASYKSFIDKAWIAISNFDLSYVQKMYAELGDSGQGGEIRAQAFYQHNRGKQSKEIYQQRIEALEMKDNHLKITDPEHVELLYEIIQLKKYRDEIAKDENL